MIFVLMTLIHQPQLFMLLLGCKPAGRNTEQHDIFFGIGTSLKDLKPSIEAFWPEAEGRIHIDSWRQVTAVDGYSISIEERSGNIVPGSNKLFFLNLGGYKENDLEEYHYKVIVVAPDKGKAIDQAKQTAFYKHCGFPGAVSHIDDKYGIDVDDIYEIEDILPASIKNKYRIRVKADAAEEDNLNIGYLKLSKL
jgi:hypothetical protein